MSKSISEYGEEKFVVEFMIIKRVRVWSGDSIQAERDGFQKLSNQEQKLASKMRICDADGKPLHPEFFEFDREFVEDV